MAVSRQDDVAPGEGAVVTVGTYDGVHLGHRRLLGDVRSEAASRGCEVAIVTFDRNPLEIVRPERAPRQLTDLAFKLELLRGLGPARIVVLTFDEARAAEEPEDFVREVLVEELHAKAILVGSSFRFGHRQRGDVALLEKLGERYGYETGTLGLVTDEKTHEVVSSSRIRSLVQNGALIEAARLLARPHEVRGTASMRGSMRIIEVPASIVLPKAGRYRVRFGPVGDAHEDGLVVVPEVGEERTGTVELAVQSASDARAFASGASSVLFVADHDELDDDALDETARTRH